MAAPVAGEIGTHFIQTFEASAIHLVQQKLSKLRSKVLEKHPGPTDKHSFRMVKPRGAIVDRVGDPGTVAAKRTATVFVDTEYAERVCTTKEVAAADSYSKPDQRRMLEDPGSDIYRAMLPQVARKIDDLIFAALNAAALDTLGNSYAFGTDASTNGGHTVGGATQAMDFASVNTLLEYFGVDEVDPDEEKFLCVTPNAVKKILALATATSGDYVAGLPLMSGKVVQGWLGFTWIVSNRVTVASAGTKQRYYNAWTRDAIGLLVLSDIEFNSGVSPMNSFDTIMRIAAEMGAVRIQDQKVKRLHILES